MRYYCEKCHEDMGMKYCTKCMERCIIKLEIQDGVLERYHGHESEVILPDDGSIVSIGRNAFDSCKGLKKVILPEGLEKIDNYAFWNCSDLESIHIPASVTKISGGAFQNISAESIKISPKNPRFEVRNNCIIDKIDKRLACGFKNTVIPDDGSILSIGESAFEACSIKIVILPEGLKTIGINAFLDCPKLESIYIPASVENISSTAFVATPLKAITISPKNSKFEIKNGCIIDKIKKELIYGDDNCVIPDDGSVRSIGEDAFGGGMTKIFIPKNITEIKEDAFINCLDIEDIHMSKQLYDSIIESEIDIGIDLSEIKVHFI